MTYKGDPINPFDNSGKVELSFDEKTLIDIIRRGGMPARTIYQRALRMKNTQLNLGKSIGELIGVLFVFLVSVILFGSAIGVWIKLFWIGWVFAP